MWYNGANPLEVNGGMSQTDGVGQTNVGRNQLSGWKYSVLQAKYSTPHWYFNGYREQSQSGKSFALNRYAGAQLTPANVGGLALAWTYRSGDRSDGSDGTSRTSFNATPLLVDERFDAPVAARVPYGQGAVIILTEWTAGASDKNAATLAGSWLHHAAAYRSAK